MSSVFRAMTTDFGPVRSQTRILAIAVILAYRTTDAVAVESGYPANVRNDMANSASQEAAAGKRVVALAPFQMSGAAPTTPIRIHNCSTSPPTS
jgi:hypothetical protein